MVEMYLNPQEDQYGLKYGYVDQVGLSGINLGAQDCIIEMLFKNYVADTTFLPSIGDWLFQLQWGEPGFANRIQLVHANLPPIQYNCGVLSGGVWKLDTYLPMDQIFKGTVHLFCVLRELSAYLCCNGHNLRDVAKTAHDINTTRLMFFSRNVYNGGICTPSIGSMLRLYIGDLSGFSDADILSLHRKYLRTPMITPNELLPYEAFRWVGRQADGSQILSAATTIQNCAPGSAGYGETLALQGGLNFGQARSKIWGAR